MNWKSLREKAASTSNEGGIGSAIGAILAISLVVACGAGRVGAQATCRAQSNVSVLNVIDLFNSTVTNLGSDQFGNAQFQINFKFSDTGGVTTNCTGSPSCTANGIPSFDGFTPRQDLTGNITAMHNMGSCGTAAFFTSSPNATWVLWAYTVNFEQNGVPSTETFQAGMSIDPQVIPPVGQSTSLANLLL